MTTQEEISIPQRKGKIAVLTIGSIAFVVIAISMWINADAQTTMSPEDARIGGIAAGLFFSLTAVYGFINLRNKKPGLVINNEGITNNSNNTGGMQVKWSDVTKVERKTVEGDEFLLLMISNPSENLANSSGVSKMWLTANHKLYGTPFSISTKTLKTNLGELEGIIRTRIPLT